jgi:hypothetical protein
MCYHLLTPLWLHIYLTHTHTLTVLFMHSLCVFKTKRRDIRLYKTYVYFIKINKYVYILKNECQMLLLRDFSSSQVKLKKYSNDFKTSNQVCGWEPVLSICIVFLILFLFTLQYIHTYLYMLRNHCWVP